MTTHISRRSVGSLILGSTLFTAAASAAPPKTMRAIILEKFGGPEVLKVTRIPVPEPKAGEVQIRVAYVGLNPLDEMVRANTFRFHPPLPFVMGKGFSGKITKVGAGVDPKRIGQRVTSGDWGGYADYVAVNADQATPMEEGFDWKFGTVAVGPTLTAWHLLHTMARAGAGDVVVVHAAAGAVGIMLVQIAHEMGCKVVGLAGSAEKIAWAKDRVTADLWLDYRADAAWPKKVKEFAATLKPARQGADFIFDGNEGPDALKNLDALAPLGQVIFIGGMAGPPPAVPIPTLIVGSAGVRGFQLPHALERAKDNGLAEILPKLKSGAWKFPIAAPVPLERVPDLHRAAEARTLLGRGIVSVGGDL